MKIAVGVLEHCGDVGGDIIAFIRKRDDERAVLAGRIDFAGKVFKKNSEGIRAVDFFESRANGAKRIVRGTVVIIDELCRDLGVGLRHKGIALLGQKVFERNIVFDNAVMNKRKIFRPMGVGVDIRRFAVRRPAGVSDPAERGKRGIVLLQLFFDVPNPSFCLDRRNAVLFENGDSGGVIAPIFQGF